jgi:hypothetical protein
MSSWMNRHIPRRRDLTQIPEELRPPAPIPRAERTEVVTSETYQYREEESMSGSPFFMGDSESYNPVYYPASSPSSHSTYASLFPNLPGSSSSSKDKTTKALSSLLTSLTSQYIQIQPPNPKATELMIDGKTYVFVILRNIRNPADNDLWITSYNSIRKFYTNKIIIIDDNSSMNTVNGKLYETDILYSDYPGAGECLPYFYFLMHRWADRMIFLHDTMFLHRRFLQHEVDTTLQFHWHFNPTDKEYVPRIQQLITSLKHHEPLLPHLSPESRSQWKACFGVACVIDLSVVNLLEEKYKLFSTTVLMIRNRKDRQMMERLFGLVVFHENLVTTDKCSAFGDILNYPKCFESQDTTVKTATYEVEQAGYNTAILKVWRGR